MPPKPRSTPKAAKRAGTATKKKAPAAAERLLPGPKEMIVRMYRQGLGDCFLLALPSKRKAAPKYVLIDCGVHKRQDEGPARLALVMSHLAAATGARLDVVVATHEHADHLSGFVQKGSPFLGGEIDVESVWVAWTEKPGDRQAATLRRKRNAARWVIAQALKKAKKVNESDASFVARINAIGEFDEPADGSTDDARAEAVIDAARRADRAGAEPLPAEALALGAAAAAGGAKRTKASSNEIALQLLVSTAGRERTTYCEPGDVRQVKDVRDFRAYVLGPPRQDGLLKQSDPHKIRGASEGDPGGVYKEVYLTSRGENMTLALSPALGVDADILSENATDDWRHPFARPFRRACCFERGADATKGFSWTDEQFDPPEATEALIKDRYLDDAQEWRRIDGDWLAAAEQLALDLDGDTNNTSLALAFEWGKPGNGKVLLFAADAQVGNWLSWRDQRYRAEGKSSTADQLLERTVVYKVGHHASHNGTVRRDPRTPSSEDPVGTPFGLELMSDIIALIPVDRDAAEKEMPTPWKMPHEPLYRRLREKARHRVLRSDRKIEPLEKSERPDTVPPSSQWTAVPGLPGARWRRSKDEFDNGTGSLCYDIALDLE